MEAVVSVEVAFAECEPKGAREVLEAKGSRLLAEANALLLLVDALQTPFEALCSDLKHMPHREGDSRDQSLMRPEAEAERSCATRLLCSSLSFHRLVRNRNILLLMVRVAGLEPA